MMDTISPAYDEFAQKYNAQKKQVLICERIADLETPVAAFLKIAHGVPHSILLESVADGDMRGRYSAIALMPDLIFRVRDGRADINRNALASNVFTPLAQPPLEALRDLVKENHIADLPPDLPGVAVGLFGYMGYDMVREMEVLPDNNPRALDVDDCLLIRPTIIVLFDNVTDMLYLVAPIHPQDSVDAQRAYEEARIRIQTIVDKLYDPLPPPPFEDLSEHAIDFEHAEPQSNMTRAAYYAMVECAREYICAGDAFQIVVSQRFCIDYPLPPFTLYRALRRVNPSPYLFFCNFDDFSIIGSSPEVLVSVTAGDVNIRPIAGTRKRGATDEDDKAIAEDLLADAKERAEHLMLLDLGRNDVGRVSEMETVDVTMAFGLQKTSHLLHIVSNVTGKLARGYDVLDALQAGFPAGTVSGAPKIRAMEIIDELEPEKRGIYAGAIGYFAANGDMDMCIALRTGIIKEKKLYVQAGGGIVYDSTPEYEYNETVNKAAALFRAAKEAQRIAAQRQNR